MCLDYKQRPADWKHWIIAGALALIYYDVRQVLEPLYSSLPRKFLYFFGHLYGRVILPPRSLKAMVTLFLYGFKILLECIRPPFYFEGDRNIYISESPVVYFWLIYFVHLSLQGEALHVENSWASRHFLQRHKITLPCCLLSSSSHSAFLKCTFVQPTFNLSTQIPTFVPPNR